MSSKKVYIYQCSKCGKTFTFRDFADMCCSPKICSIDDCKDECKFPYTICEKHRHIQAKEKFNSLPVVGWNKLPFSELDSDRWFDEPDEYLEYCEENEFEPEEFLYPSKSYQWVKIDLDRIIESFEEFDDGYGFEEYTRRLKGVEELQKAIDDFKEKNKDLVYYYPNKKEKFKVKK